MTPFSAFISEATLRPSPTRAVHAGDEVLDRVPLGRQRREGHVRPPERLRRGGGGAGVDVKAFTRFHPTLYTFDVESLRKYTPAVRGAGRVAGWWVAGNILPRYTTGLTPTAGAATCRPAGIRSKTQREICACAELQPCAPAGRRSVAASSRSGFICGRRTAVCSLGCVTEDFMRSDVRSTALSPLLVRSSGRRAGERDGPIAGRSARARDDRALARRSWTLVPRLKRGLGG